MNRTSLSLSMMTLGIVIGITATHFKHVHDLAEYDSSMRTSLEGKSASAKRHRSEAHKLEDSKSLAGKRHMEHAMLKELGDHTRKTVAMPNQNDALVEILTAIRAEQRALKKQISESNRELHELTFRVDTHSDSFKPLHSIEDRPSPMDSRVESYDSRGPGLLPPRQ